MSQQIDRQRLVETLKANHRDPRNLAMHVVGFWFVFRALKRLLTGHFLKAVLNGGYAPVTAANPRPYGMPPYFAVLSDQDVASVLTYVRASWGNSGAPVSAQDVERYR